MVQASYGLRSNTVHPPLDEPSPFVICYRRPRSVVSYHLFVFFALSCAKANTAYKSQTYEVVRRDELTFALGTVQSLTEG